MSRIMSFIKSRKEKARINAEMELRDEFRVVERNGSLWLTHCGCAFMKMPDDAKSCEITELLNKARSVAVEFMEV